MLRTYLVYNTVVRLCQFFCRGGKVLLQPEKKVLVVCLAGCAVVVLAITTRNKKSSSRLSGGLSVVGSGDYDRKKKFQSSVWRVVLLCQFSVLARNRFWLYTLLCTWSTIQLWCCVIFIGSGGK